MLLHDFCLWYVTCVILTTFDYLLNLICLFVYMLYHVVYMFVCIIGVLEFVILVNLLRLSIKLLLEKKREREREREKGMEGRRGCGRDRGRGTKRAQESRDERETTAVPEQERGLKPKTKWRRLYNK